MKRGEVWTVSGGPDYASRPRPAVIVQDTSAFPATESVTICPITTTHVEAPLTRVGIDPGQDSGLATRSAVMVDKMTTVAKSKLGKRVGRLSDEQMDRVRQAVLVFLGLTTLWVISRFVAGSA